MDTVDYAIVGGGVAGTYAAWRLSNAYPDASIRLFEASDHIGGRLLTADMPRMPFKVELGAMRFTTRQVLVKHTVEQLRIKTKPFSFDCKGYYLRGEHFTPNSALLYRTRPEDPAGVPRYAFPANGAFPYKVGINERGLDPGELIKLGIRCALADVKFPPGSSQEIKTIARILAALRNPIIPLLNVDILTPRQWSLLKRKGELKGSPLYAVGFWNLLQFYLSSEAYLFAHDGLGYESVVTNWNAAEAIHWYLRDFDVNFLTPIAGMQSIPRTLAHRFELRNPGSLEREQRLKLVSKEGDDGFSLQFKDRSEPVRCRHLILALDKAALRGIEFLGFPDAERLRTAFESVVAQRLFKLFLGYEYAWWNNPRGIGCPSGKIITDLPIRQVYYWGPDKAKVTSTPRAMLMASYSDAHYVDYWAPLHRQDSKDYYRPEGSHKKLEREERITSESFAVTKNMVLKAHRQVMQLHPELAGTDSIPVPISALVQEWPNGWHTWKVHTDAPVWIEYLVQPFDPLRLFICGEAYSSEQGWVEGALRSVERVLDRIGVPKPNIEDEQYQRQNYTHPFYENYIRDGVVP